MWAVNDAFTKSKYDVKKTKNKKHKWSQKNLTELNTKATNIWIVRLTRVLHINNLYYQLRPLVPLGMIRNKNKKILPVAVQCFCISVCVLCLLTTKHNDCRTRQTFHTKSLKCGGPLAVGQFAGGKTQVASSNLNCCGLYIKETQRLQIFHKLY